MSEKLQLLLVLIIVIIAVACFLFRLRSPKGMCDDDCSKCDLYDHCKKKK